MEKVFTTVGDDAAHKVRAAQYVRMSTEHQRYSIDNQTDAIREFADAAGYEIVATYKDAGRSGLNLEGRAGLQRLLADIEGKLAEFEVVLVYDVSRWGRFQNIDESASYEFRCLIAGVRIEYCAEQFANDGSIGSDVLKAIKRSMAAEHSRVLSVKVFAGQSRLIGMGYRQGGAPGIGLRRLLVDQNGRAKTLLGPSEYKSLQTDRVILVPGPPEEIATVRWIYDAFVKGGRTELEIARSLNARGIVTDLSRAWTRETVHQVITNEKYIGNNVWNRRSCKLKRKWVTNKSSFWVRAESAFEPIVDRRLFDRAQAISKARSVHMGNEQMLQTLANLLKKRRTLSGSIIDGAANCPPSSRYKARFGTLLRAYKLIGYDPPQNYRFFEVNKRLRAMRLEVIRDTLATIEKSAGSATVELDAGLFRVNDEFTVSIGIARCRATAYGYLRWLIPLGRGVTPDIAVAVRMNPDNMTVRDYLIVPTTEIDGATLEIAANNGLRFDAFFFKTLDPLFALAERNLIKAAS